MDFSAVALTEDQQAFAKEVRAFLDEHVTDELKAGLRERSSTYDEGLYLAMGAKGWLFPRWSKEDGGAALDDVKIKILETEWNKRLESNTMLNTTSMCWPAVEKDGDPSLSAELKP